MSHPVWASLLLEAIASEAGSLRIQWPTMEDIDDSLDHE